MVINKVFWKLKKKRNRKMITVTVGLGEVLRLSWGEVSSHMPL
jgi:hypothetical protein